MPTRIIPMISSAVLRRSRGWLTSPEPLYGKTIEWLRRRIIADEEDVSQPRRACWAPGLTKPVVAVVDNLPWHRHAVGEQVFVEDAAQQRSSGWLFSPEPLYQKTVEWLRHQQQAEDYVPPDRRTAKWFPGLTSSVIIVADNLPWLRHLQAELLIVEDASPHRTVGWLYSPEPVYGKTVEWFRRLPGEQPPLEEFPNRRIVTAAIVVSPPPPPPPPAGPYFPFPRRPLDQSQFEIEISYVSPTRRLAGVLYGPITPQPPRPLAFQRPFVARVPNLSDNQGTVTAQGEDRLRRFTEIVQSCLNSLYSQGFIVSTGQTQYAIHGGGYVQARAPTNIDDVTVGVQPGMIWVNSITDQAYVNVDNSYGAAVWKQITV